MPEAALGPTLGRMDGAVHVYPVRVYYEDTDAGGIVYHANYLRFAERARTEMLRLVVDGYRRIMAEAQVGYAVRRCTLDFLRPARLDDALEIRTRLLAAQGATMSAEQRVVRDAADLVRIAITVACIGRDGRPRRIPEPVRRATAGLIRGEGASA